MKKGPKFKFPEPKKCKAGDQAILCPAERVINLYNQATGLVFLCELVSTRGTVTLSFGRPPVLLRQNEPVR